MDDIEFSDTLAFPYFWSDPIENLYASSKSVEVVWYEVSRGYAALIEIYGLFKVVRFFWTTGYISLLPINISSIPQKVVCTITKTFLLCMWLACGFIHYTKLKFSIAYAL